MYFKESILAHLIRIYLKYLRENTFGFQIIRVGKKEIESINKVNLNTYKRGSFIFNQLSPSIRPSFDFYSNIKSLGQ
mgnify:CR=1 FL=1